MRKFDKKRPDKFIFDFGQIRAFERYNLSCPLALFVGRCKKRQEHKEMSVIFSQIPALLWRTLGRLVGPAGATLFSLVLASCAGGGFGGTGDAGNAPDIPGVNPVSEPVSVAAGPISAEGQRKVAEVVSGLDLGEETPPISSEDIAVSNDSGILDSNPFSSSASAARSSGWGVRADSARKTAGYKAFEVAVPSDNPLMTVAVWISETPLDYPEGKSEQDPEADRKFLYLRLRVFIEAGNVALVEGGGVEVLETDVIVVEEKRPDPKPVVPEEPEAPEAPACSAGEFRGEDGNCAPILSADLHCPAGTMSAGGLTQEELNLTLWAAAAGGNAVKFCEALRRGADVMAKNNRPLFRCEGNAEVAALLLAAGGECLSIPNAPALVAVNFSSSGSGTVSAEGESGALVAGGEVRQGSTVTFTAIPDAGYYVSGWWNCPENGTAKSCEMAADFDFSVGAIFTDINECATNTHACAAEGGLCANTDGGFACSCAVGYSGDGRTCNADKAVPDPNAPVLAAVNFSSSGSGTVSAEGESGALVAGGEVRQGSTVTFTAISGAGYYVSGWSGNCADAGEVADGLDGTAKSCAAVADSDLSVRAEFSEIPSLAGPLCPSGSLPTNGLTRAELNMTLRLAARGGDAARVCEALRRGAEVNDNLGDLEFTALQEAVDGGYLNVSELLLANEAEVNKRKGGAGRSPLDLAAREEEAEIAALLRNAGGRCFLEAGPLCGDIPAATPDPATVAATVAGYSCPAGSLPRGDHTQEQLDDNLHAAGWDLSAERVCEWLRRGADVNARRGHETLLHVAAWGAHEIAALLIANGADVNAQGRRDETPLYAAATWDDREMAVLLIANGADVNVKTYTTTPLHEAAKWNSEEVAALLLENGADVNAAVRSNRRGAPLHEAAKWNSEEVAALLIANGADVNARAHWNGTPLHQAAYYNSEEVAALLIANGADVNAETIGVGTLTHDMGGTALEVAGRQGHAAIVALLEAAENPPVAAEADALAEELRESFAGGFNPSPAFGDAFGAVSGSSERFLTRLNSLMRATSGTGGDSWDSFSGWRTENEHGRFWFSTGQRGDFGFGAGGNGAGGDFSVSPFAALAGNGMLAGGETGLGADGKLRIAAFADYQAKSLLDGEDKRWTQWAARGTAIETAMTEAERFSGLSENRTRGAMTEIHLGGGDAGVALQAGAVSESDSVLSGTAGNDDLRGLRSRTAFAGLSGAADLFDSGWRLRGSAHLGRSWAESEGLLRDSDLWASAFSAGLERGGWLYSDDGFVLRFSQPLRVESWEMELTDERGESRLGAGSSGRQLDVDAAYRLPLSGGGWLLLSAGVRRDGGHSSSSDLEAGALFSVERGF